MKIIVDAMGGDNAPESAAWGGALAAKEYSEEVLLVGDPDKVATVLKDKGMEHTPGVTIMPASDLVDMHDDPATVLRHKPDSSMAVAFKLLKSGEGDALVSAGNTGALLTGATLYGGRIKGIRRGALAPVMPCKSGQVMLCDAGANTECTAEMLLQFAFLGSLYVEKINGIKNPRVGLVNNGTEDTKGDPLRKEAYALLKKAGDEGRLNFVGNVEGSMVPLGACDIAVCDGYSGNVMLKTIEGVGSFLGRELKGMFLKSLKTKVAALLVKDGLTAFKDRLNPDTIGGTPFLGLTKPVIKAHGSSGALAIENAVAQAVAAAQGNISADIEANIERMKVER